MSTTETGRMAEDAAAEYLKSNGYKVLAQNWRTRWCEIDIVATKNSVAYFVEVKYRKSDNWGDGLDAITHKKLEQMAFAAEFWVSDNKWRGDYQLAAVSATGNPPIITNFIVL